MKDGMKRTLQNVALSVSMIAIMVVAFEVLLRMFFPFSVTNVGYAGTPNGQRFGWGFAPHGWVRIEDPDTGKSWLDQVNNHGWRDRDRTYVKPSGVFRIVVLGDSNVFGYIVRTQDTFTHVLEKMLTDGGYKVEVLNIAYSGWGTDQALEALRIEAAKYAPDLVVYNFATNDPDDNIWYQDDGKFGERKPFYYELDDKGIVHRHDNARFAKAQRRITRNDLLAHSEILKRLWVVYKGLGAENKRSYVLRQRRLSRIAYFLRIDETHPFILALKAEGDRETTLEDLRKLFAEHGFADAADRLLPIFEDFEFNDRPLITGTWKPDFDKYNWRLTRALIGEMSKAAKDIGADFAISSDHDAGTYERERQWLAIADDEETRRVYNLVNDYLEEICRSVGASFIKSVEGQQRAKYDGHATAAGNHAMARNINRYVLERYGQRLPKRQ